MDGHLEVKVVSCTWLKNTKWISKQDPYVTLQYANSKFRTRTCKNGHKNPKFDEKFGLSLNEGLREIYIEVWNCNIFTRDKFIGSGKIHLQKVLAEGLDDNSWAIYNSGRSAGEVSLIMRYTKSLKPAAPPHAVLPTPHVALSSAPQPPYTVPNPTSVITTYWTHTTNYPSYPPTSSANYPPNYPPPSQPYAAPYSAHPPPPSFGSAY